MLQRHVREAMLLCGIWFEVLEQSSSSKGSKRKRCVLCNSKGDRKTSNIYKCKAFISNDHSKIACQKDS